MRSQLAEIERRETMRLLVHDLRNPVAAIVYASELLKRKLPESPAQAALLAVVDNARSAALEIDLRLQKLSSYARSQEDDSSPRAFTVMDLIRWWQDHTSCNLKGIRLAGLDQHAALQLNGDMPRLALCIEQLIRNGLKVSETAGIDFRIESDDNRLHLIVEDLGPGIPTDLVEDLFKTCQSSTPTMQLGLGLAMAQRLAFEHRGELRLARASKPTTFVLDLPIFN